MPPYVLVDGCCCRTRRLSEVHRRLKRRRYSTGGIVPRSEKLVLVLHCWNPFERGSLVPSICQTFL
jgi:hypothetical protein